MKLFQQYTRGMFKNIQQSKKMVIIKNGDHSLSNQRPLRKIVEELEIIIKDII